MHKLKIIKKGEDNHYGTNRKKRVKYIPISGIMWVRQNQQKKYKTIKLPENLNEKQIQQELIIQLDKFEKEVQKGTYLDGNITLNEFAEKWLKDYAEPNLKPKTYTHYKKLLERILFALGHKKLDSIQPTTQSELKMIQLDFVKIMNLL